MRAAYCGQSECALCILGYMSKTLPEEQALQEMERAEKTARTWNEAQCASTIADFKFTYQLHRDGSEPAFAISLLFIGGPGTGKATGMASFQATGLRDRFRSESQEDRLDLDLPRRTVGMPISEFTFGGVTFYMKDLAGQENFSIGHDLFTVTSTIPALALAFLNASDSPEKAGSGVWSCTGDLISRHKSAAGPGDSRLAVGFVATRCDKISSEQETAIRAVLKTVEEELGKLLKFHFVTFLNARCSRSAAMLDLRSNVLEVSNGILKRCA